MINEDELTPELKKELEEFERSQPEIYEFSKTMIKSGMRTFKSVYIDLPMIQDIYLGTILLLVGGNSKKDYDYLLSRMSFYNKRLLINPTLSFPEFNLTFDRVKEYIQDPINTIPIISYSPMTTFFLSLPKFHTIIRDISKTNVEEKEINPISYIINTFPMDVSSNKLATKIIKSKMLDLGNDIQLGLMNNRVDTIDASIMADFDILGLYDAGMFLDPRSKSHVSFSKDVKFKDTILYTPFFIYDEESIKKIPELTEEKLEKSRKLSEALLSVQTLFSVVKTPEILLFSREKK